MVRRLLFALAALIVAGAIWVIVLIEPAHNACDCMPPPGYVSGGYRCDCPVDHDPQYIIGGIAAAVAASLAAAGFLLGKGNLDAAGAA